jgi:hypothetical protein
MQIGKLLLLGGGFSLVTACAGIYQATSSNPALVQVPKGNAAADSFDVVAVDGKTMSMPVTGRDFWHIDPGLRRLTLVYEGNRTAFGRRFTAPPIVVSARLQAGHHYRVICESRDATVKGYVRDLETNRIVSDVAEAALIPKPASAASSVPLAIPARH